MQRDIFFIDIFIVQFFFHLLILLQGTKLTFLARSHLAPKFSKVVAKVKKLGAVKKKKVKKTHYTVMSNGRVILALNLHEQTSSFAPIHLL